MNPTFASAISPEILIVVGVVVVLFGGSQIPKLARSLGEAKNEFEKSQKKDDKKSDEEKNDEA
jgi:sec-independent protein translocase protein TatA